MNLMLTEGAVPAYPFVALVIRSYRRWEEKKFPADMVSCGLYASQMEGIWALGMKSDFPHTVRDCAASVFVFCFNGLRESSVMSLLTKRVTIEDDSVFARVSIWKGQARSR